jgi:uncharacterized protein
LDSRRTLKWRGIGDDPRFEIARVTIAGANLRAVGTQIGVSYELQYQLDPGLLSVQVAGGGQLRLDLGEADFFDLGFSPLFNSLPVLRDDLLRAHLPRDYAMLWVSVPDLTVEHSEQRYDPMGDNRIRFSAGVFVAHLVFDDDGFIVDYPGLAVRVS